MKWREVTWTPRRIIWATVLSVVVAVLAGFLLHVDPLVGTLLPMVLGWMLGLTLAAHILIGWIPRWRRFFWRIFLVLALPLLPLASFTFTFGYFWNRGDAAAHAYVAAVRPMLENFHNVHGRYPSNLAEVPAAPPNLVACSTSMNRTKIRTCSSSMEIVIQVPPANGSTMIDVPMPSRWTCEEFDKIL